jgi:hypothetical protein
MHAYRLKLFFYSCDQVRRRVFGDDVAVLLLVLVVARVVRVEAGRVRVVRLEAEAEAVAQVERLALESIL